MMDEIVYTVRNRVYTIRSMREFTNPYIASTFKWYRWSNKGTIIHTHIFLRNIYNFYTKWYICCYRIAQKFELENIIKGLPPAIYVNIPVKGDYVYKIFISIYLFTLFLYYYLY